MSDSKLRTQSLDFAVSIINPVKDLKEKHESIMSKYDELNSACTSIRVMLISPLNTLKENQ